MTDEQQPETIVSRVVGEGSTREDLMQMDPVCLRALFRERIHHRMKYDAKKVGFTVTCHQLRHTMATQMLNADADLVTIQDLLGHTYIRTTERYCRVSNQKVRRDYYQAMAKVIARHRPMGKKTLDKEEILINEVGS